MFPVSNCIFLTEYPCLLPKEFVAWVGYRVSSLDILEKMHGHCLGFCLHKHAIAWLFVYQDPKRVHSMLQSTNLLWTPLNTWFMCRLPPLKQQCRSKSHHVMPIGPSLCSLFCGSHCTVGGISPKKDQLISGILEGMAATVLVRAAKR